VRMNHMDPESNSKLAWLGAALQWMKYERDAAFRREEDLEVELAAYEVLLGTAFASIDAGEQESE
jgi:hypothetical protein